jgi:para-nitrobenzyl esterase
MKTSCWVCTVLAATSASAVLAAKPAPIATVDGGIIRGSVTNGIASFKGIPFAAPPIGNLRWRAPQPARPWKGVRDATHYGHDCAQVPFPSDAAPLGTAPSEDCLVMNIWRPETIGAKKVPVLFWIYGGGFVNGGSSPDVYSGAALAKQGIMVVSFNYRLGRLGFFAHPALSAEQAGKAGNYALMDQLAALQWVKRNIARFGGDPAAVTIMGESAGGGSVTSLMNQPAARGLFHGAINMSGGGRDGGPLGTPRLLRKDQPNLPSAESVGLAFAQKIGVPGTDAAALKALRALPADQIIDGFNLASLFTGAMGGPTGPVIDNVTVFGTNQQVLARSGQNKVPVMIGATSADIGFFPASTKDEVFATFGDKADLARHLFDPGDALPLQALIFKIGGIRGMIEPARYVASRYAAAGQTVWHYRFGYVAESIRAPGMGAGHASDIPFFFNTVKAKYGDTLTAADIQAAAQISAYVVNFVKRGNPNGAGLPRWGKFDATQPVMDFTTDRGAVSGADPWKVQLDLAEGLTKK